MNGQSNYSRMDRCPAPGCTNLKRNSSRWCKDCSPSMHQREAGRELMRPWARMMALRLIELDREHKGLPSYVDELARSIVPRMGRVE